MREVDGGPRYYAQFANGLLGVGGGFPIGAWLRPAHDREHFGDYHNFGMNLFVGVENPELANEAMIRSNGMRSLIQADERTRFDGLGSEVAGWLLDDEVDMRFGPGSDTVNSQGRGYDVMRNAANPSPPTADSSMRTTERAFWSGIRMRSRRAGSTASRRSSPPTTTGSRIRTRVAINPLSASARAMAKTSSVFATSTASTGGGTGLELRRARLAVEREPRHHGGRILPAEIKSAVWHSIIAGARGIIYFDHNFGPGTPGSTIMEEGYEDNRVATSQVNAQIKRLARVLDAPFVTSRHSATDTMDGTVRYMVKWANGKFWVFAGADRGGGSVTVSIPCVGNAKAVVGGETRSLAINNGSFTDAFADKNAVHIYRIDGGSSCGLAK